MGALWRADPPLHRARPARNRWRCATPDQPRRDAVQRSFSGVPDMIDLRSDTVTKPTPEMRRAMMEAEVGDDVYGEDPTVNLLESRAAAITGKKAPLFVPTGTMGNTIAVKLHTRHGEEVICDVRAHVLEYELSMLAWFSGCVGRPIQTADGIMSWEQIAREIRPLGPLSWRPPQTGRPAGPRAGAAGSAHRRHRYRRAARSTPKSFHR